MSGELHQKDIDMSTAIGKLDGKMDMVVSAVNNLNVKVDKLNDRGSTTAAKAIDNEKSIADLKSHIKDNVDPHIEEFKKSKNVGKGVIVGAAASGGMGVLGIKALLAKLGFWTG